MTNGDKIRQMTDEELSESLMDSICNMIPDDVCLAGKRTCEECVLAFLRQEADTEEHE